MQLMLICSYDTHQRDTHLMTVTYSGTTRLSRYQNVSILDFIGAEFVVMIWLELCTSFSCSKVVATTSVILSSNKIQNGDILVPANTGWPGKWPISECRNDDGGSGDNSSYMTCKAPVRLTLPTNQHLASLFLQAGSPFYHQTNSVRALKEKVSISTGLLTPRPELTWGLPTLSSATKSSCLPWEELQCLSSGEASVNLFLVIVM